MKSLKRQLEGVVISNKMEKTVVVEVKRMVRDSLFHKYHTDRKKYKAHDENKRCQVGDKVVIKQSKPISKEKRWVVVDVLVSAVA